MDTYLVVLGRESELGAAELRTLLTVRDPAATTLNVAPDVMLVQPTEALDVAELMSRLGGSRLIARVLGVIDKASAGLIEPLIPSDVKELAISSPSLAANTRMKLLLELKHARPGLRYRPNSDSYLASGLSERLVRRSDGFELLLVRDASGTFAAAQVVAVQDARAWTDRDRGLPAVDAVAGLLPPKLARIMVNLAEPARGGQPGVLLDPFCGSGQIPIEALRLGWQVRASDIDPKAIQRTTMNVDWAVDRYQIAQSALLDIRQADIASVAESMPPASVDAIVAEPDLGPALRANDPIPSNERLHQVLATVAGTFQAGRTVLRPGGRLVLVIPKIAGVRMYDRLLNPEFTRGIDAAATSGYILEESFTYARPDARVEREIFVFDYKG